MKKLAKYIIQFIKEDFNSWSYGVAFIFLIALISFNYSVGFERKFLQHYYKQPPIGMLLYFSFYAVVYYMMVVQKLLIGKEGSILKNYKFWLKSFLFILLLGLSIGFSYIDIWADTALNGYEERYEAFFVQKLSGNLRFDIVLIVPLIIIWKIFDSESKRPFGFTTKNFHARSYFLILLLLLPLVAAASFQPEFLKMYPKFKPWFPQDDIFGLSRFQMSAIYELTYASNFVMIEWFFRGALVIGMVAIIGRNAVLPMAVLYCSIHFGKPMAECISSFFGGYLLGIIAMYTRSIFGGCIIHLGVALLMEAFAMMQYYFRSGS